MSSSHLADCPGPLRLDVASESECQYRKARYVCPHGFDVWRVLSEPETIVPPVKGSHDAKLPDPLCAACGTAPAKRASRYCVGCQGTEAACAFCERSKDFGHGACSRHGGIGSAARKKMHFADFLTRKRRRKLTGSPVRAGA